MRRKPAPARPSIQGCSSWWSSPGPPCSSSSGWPLPTSTICRETPSSSSTWRARASAIQLPVPERVLGLHHLVDLGGALVDDGSPRVAEVALDRVLGRIAVGAVHLDRLVGGVECALGGVPLGQRGLARVALTLVLQPGRL